MPSDKGVVHVIDDDEAMRESLSFLLGAVGMEVQTYESAEAFLKVAPTAKAGCVITDVRMPGLSGVELLRQLRDRQVSIPVIMITGHGDVPLAVEAMKIGAMDFLEKPFDDEALLASVRSALDQLDRDQKRQAERGEPRARCPAGPRCGPCEQTDRLRPRDQPAHDRDLSGESHDQDAGGEPVGSRADGSHRGASRDRFERAKSPLTGRQSPLTASTAPARI
jgi:FixJ family two-component response regulator